MLAPLEGLGCWIIGGDERVDGVVEFRFEVFSRASPSGVR